LSGEGIEADGPKGIELLTKAANGGNARAQMWLGARYYAGKDGVKKDRTKALFLYEQAAAQSDTSVLVVLGRLVFLSRY
jgi:TPR repeat protein